MLHLLFLIISYGSLMLLSMKATTAAIIPTAVALVIGICLIISTKFHKVPYWKSKQYFLIPTAILLLVPLGLNFDNRWLPSSKMQMLSTVLHIPIEMLLLFGSVTLSALSVYFLYAVLQILVKKLSDIDPQNDLGRSFVSCILTSVITVVLAQLMVGADVFSMGSLNFIWGVLIVSTSILLMYCLLGRIIPAIFSGAGFFMVISTINVYVYNFRERLFEPVDIFSASTAMNVVENYDLFPIPIEILAGWCSFTAVLIALSHLQRKSKSKLAPKKRYALLVICIFSSVAISFYTANLPTRHWHMQGAQFNGYILDFVSKLKEITIPEPDHYNIELIDELADRYAADRTDASQGDSEHPHIIVIMDEAFSDLSVMGELATNTEVMPFISSLKENTISGYALSSVYGGNTANSEYEFLTGNSLAWLSPNVVPYQQYIRSSAYSMVSYLKSFYNYKCVVMHPFESSGWNRPVAYEHLGFDECYFVEDFPQKNLLREYVSDQEMFEFLIETFEEQKENPLFLFGVTMQNHGSYAYDGENYTQHISLLEHGEEYPEVEQYLSVIYETDRAVEYLLRYFQDVDEDVVIVFFGDHQPKLTEEFYETVLGATTDTLDEQQKLYEVPFFIWANYDIEEKQMDRTSLNYLSSYVYDVAGITLPPYNNFLQVGEEMIPSINANGFYSLSAARYLSFEEANEEELRWLETYEALQYNSLFDTTQRNQTFFPVLE